MDDGPEYRAIVVGGGFFGCALAAELRLREGGRVALLEAGPRLLGRASYANQARVHNGYHYPRSILTGLRSRVNFPRFALDFSDCIVDDFEAYYAVARRFSKVTARQFRLFCERIGAPLGRAPARVRALFSPDAVEDVFAVRESAFDANALRQRMQTRLGEAGVELLLGAEALRVEPRRGRGVVVRCRHDGEQRMWTAGRVFNCTYSRVNRLLHDSGLCPVSLKHELTELALVEVPEPFRRIALTVMCGPFFSVMPFPARGLHSLSHVRYTPHCAWHDRAGKPYRDPYALLDDVTPRSNFVRMVRDAQRFVPALSECRYVESIWEVKTVLPSAERDDGRPILFTADPDLSEVVTVMGGKLDNVYDVLEYQTAARDGRAA